MLSFSKVIKISRPRFWFYTFGPFLIGWIAGIDPSLASLHDSSRRAEVMVNFHWGYLLLLLLCVDYFIFGANVLIYGVNDLADEDTDALNDKKGDYEHHLKSQERTGLKRRVLALTTLEGGAITLGLTYLLRVTNTLGRRTVPCVMAAFWLSSIFYSMKPLRAKAHPFVDGLFNVLYIIPSMIGRLVVSRTRTGFGWRGFVAGRLWAMSMHAYSAIPDIQPDTHAGLTTTAVFLGEKGTLLYCGGLWLVAAMLAAVQGGWPFALLGIPYLVMIALSWNGSVDKLYRWFPWINAVVGFMLFWGIVLV